MLASGEHPQPTLPTAESVRELPFLDAVVHESLRCFPPISAGVGRQLSQDVVVNGRTLPKGTILSCAIWAVHYSTVAWGPDAGVWRPQRWLEARSVNACKKDASGHTRWLPFTQGTQNCLGQHLAMVRTHSLGSSAGIHWAIEDRQLIVWLMLSVRVSLLNAFSKWLSSCIWRCSFQGMRECNICGMACRWRSS